MEGKIPWQKKYMAQVDDSHMSAEMKAGPIRMTFDSYAGGHEFIMEIEGDLPRHQSERLMEDIAGLVVAATSKPLRTLIVTERGREVARLTEVKEGESKAMTLGEDEDE